MKKPNILVLFTDMQRGDTINALGNPVIRTPNLDRLVAEGTAFTNCQTPSPTCVPARASMFSGVYPQRYSFFTKVNGPRIPNELLDEDKSWPALLTGAGYNTHAIGKGHFVYGQSHGFKSREQQEENCSKPEMDDYVAWLKERGLDYYEPQGMRGEMYYIPQIATNPIEAHPTTWVGDRSIDFIEKAGDDAAPWAMFTSFIHPHPPFAPPKPWHKLYRTPMMPLPNVPDNPQSFHTYANKQCNRYKFRDRGIDQNLVRTIKAYYYACISYVDYQIGRIIEKLEETGQLENTLIIFTSDHGEYLGDYNCFGKRSMNDAASRVPMIVRYPQRFRADVRCSEPTSLVDLLPTITDTCGIPRSGLVLDGEDLAQVANGKSARKAVYSQFGATSWGIYMHVEKNWKYFYSADNEKEYLFDRRTDPNETHNLAGLPFVREEKQRLKNDLLKFLKKTGLESACAETGNGLEWEKYPPVDQSFLDDPDAGLLISDYEPYKFEMRGYTD